MFRKACLMLYPIVIAIEFQPKLMINQLGIREQGINFRYEE